MQWETVQETAEFLLSRTKYRPRIAIILGTGLGGLAALLHNVDELPYACIPNFSPTTGTVPVELLDACIRNFSPTTSTVPVELGDACIPNFSPITGSVPV